MIMVGDDHSIGWIGYLQLIVARDLHDMVGWTDDRQSLIDLKVLQMAYSYITIFVPYCSKKIEKASFERSLLLKCVLLRPRSDVGWNRFWSSITSLLPAYLWQITRLIVSAHGFFLVLEVTLVGPEVPCGCSQRYDDTWRYRSRSFDATISSRRQRLRLILLLHSDAVPARGTTNGVLR